MDIGRGVRAGGGLRADVGRRRWAGVRGVPTAASTARLVFTAEELVEFRDTAALVAGFVRLAVSPRGTGGEGLGIGRDSRGRRAVGAADARRHARTCVDGGWTAVSTVRGWLCLSSRLRSLVLWLRLLLLPRLKGLEAVRVDARWRFRGRSRRRTLRNALWARGRHVNIVTRVKNRTGELGAGC